MIELGSSYYLFMCKEMKDQKNQWIFIIRELYSALRSWRLRDLLMVNTFFYYVIVYLWR